MESPSEKQKPLGSLAPLAGETCDGQREWDIVRNALTELGKSRGEWAGVPLPHDDLPMVVARDYPFQRLQGSHLVQREEPTEYQMRRAAELCDFSKGRIFEINSWRHHKGKVMVYHTGDHRAKVSILPHENTPYAKFEKEIKTMSASQCWRLDAEIKACEKLRQLVTPTAYRYYILTGCFLETSQRSQITYFYRKLRPTVALTSRPNGVMRILCCLCLHGIGYYFGSHSGVMVPTDDVISHLMMVRGDEKKFWSKANQWSPDNPVAGL